MYSFVFCFAIYILSLVQHWYMHCVYSVCWSSLWLQYKIRPICDIDTRELLLAESLISAELLYNWTLSSRNTAANISVWNTINGTLMPQDPSLQSLLLPISSAETRHFEHYNHSLQLLTYLLTNTTTVFYVDLQSQTWIIMTITTLSVSADYTRKRYLRT